eukprot:GGOE01042810.1.p1 GENE.GGOE01042810.1~~GGOE01042810.1.p1  ORF type:complete len:441 (-),score=73.62 GGOE01042810.1:82-1404(-)
MLTRHVGRVTVLERDDGGGDPWAPAMPAQSPHSHIILRKALDVLSEYFPGLEDAALQQGAAAFSLQQLLVVVDGVPWARSGGGGILFLGCPRTTIQRVLHEDVMRDKHVEVVRGSTVTDLMSIPGGGGSAVVTGVKYRQKDSKDAVELHADLVVDCSGRHSNVVKWVERCGGSVETEEWPSRVSYASVLGTLPCTPRWGMLYLPPHPPQRRCGLCVLVVATGSPSKVLVSAIAMGSRAVPRDRQGFLKFVLAVVADCPGEDVAALLAQLQFEEDDIRKYHQPHSFRRFFTSLPLGFIPVGDAVAAFNPIFGQGIASACAAVESLDVALACNPADPQRLQCHYFSMLLPFVGRIWDLVALHDPCPNTLVTARRSFGMWMVYFYLRGVGRGMHLRWVADRWYPFVHLCAPPWAALHPMLVLAAVLGNLGITNGMRHSKHKTL